MFQVRVLTLGLCVLMLGACDKRGAGFDSAGRCLAPKSGPFSEKTSPLSQAEREKAIALVGAHHEVKHRFSSLLVDPKGGFNPYSDPLISLVQQKVSEGTCSGINDIDEMSPTRRGGLSVIGLNCPIEFGFHTLPLEYTHGLAYSSATHEYLVRFNDHALTTGEVVAIKLKGDVVGLNRLESDSSISSGCVELQGELETKTLGVVPTFFRHTSYMKAEQGMPNHSAEDLRQITPGGEHQFGAGDLPLPTQMEVLHQRSYKMDGRLVVFELSFGIVAPIQRTTVTINGEPATDEEIRALGGIDTLTQNMGNF